MSFTRTEQFLDGIASGASVPAPFTREEQYLQKIIEKVEELEAEISGGGGGAEDFVVEFTVTFDSGFSATADKTCSEVISAAADKNVKGIAPDFPMGVGDVYLYPAQITDSTVKFFSVIQTGTSSDMLLTINGDSSGWSVTVNN